MDAAEGWSRGFTPTGPVVINAWAGAAMARHARAREVRVSIADALELQILEPETPVWSELPGSEKSSVL